MYVKTKSNSEKQQQPEKKLLIRVQETLRLKHYSYRTEKTYIHHEEYAPGKLK